MSLVQQDYLRHQDGYTVRDHGPHLGERHAHRRVTPVEPVGAFVLVEKELAQPWSVGRWARPYPVERRFEPLTGAERQEPMVCGGVVRFPSAQRLLQLALVCPEYGNVEVLMLASCSAQPEIRRPASGDPPRSVKAAHDLQQSKGRKYSTNFAGWACSEGRL
jgi:hypothetical protein